MDRHLPTCKTQTMGAFRVDDCDCGFNQAVAAAAGPQAIYGPNGDDFREVDELEKIGVPIGHQLVVADPALLAALHALRVDAAYCQLHDFPIFGFDVLRKMAQLGLCDQAQADAAIAEATAKIAIEERPDQFPDDDAPGGATVDRIKDLGGDDELTF